MISSSSSLVILPASRHRAVSTWHLFYARCAVAALQRLKIQIDLFIGSAMRYVSTPKISRYNQVQMSPKNGKIKIGSHSQVPAVHLSCQFHCVGRSIQIQISFFQNDFLILLLSQFTHTCKHVCRQFNICLKIKCFHPQKVLLPIPPFFALTFSFHCCNIFFVALSPSTPGGAWSGHLFLFLPRANFGRHSGASARDRVAETLCIVHGARWR